MNTFNHVDGVRKVIPMASLRHLGATFNKRVRVPSVPANGAPPSNTATLVHMRECQQLKNLHLLLLGYKVRKTPPIY